MYGMSFQVQPLKKAPGTICGYPFRSAREDASGAPAVPSPRSEGGTCCMLPWKECAKHYSWETHKREELVCDTTTLSQRLFEYESALTVVPIAPSGHTGASRAIFEGSDTDT